MNSSIRCLAFGFCVVAQPALADPYLWVDQDAALSRFEAIVVEPVSNETGARFEFDVTDVIRTHLAAKLREQGLAVLDLPAPGKSLLTLKGQLTLYTAGSAVARWLVPGSDPTQVVMRASFIDGGKGEIVADMVVGGYVGGGGLFSIGADRWILEKIAEHVATAVRQRRDAEQKGGRSR